MLIVVKLYLKPRVRVGRYLVTLDNRQIQSSPFPIASVSSSNLSVALEKTDPRDARRHVRNVRLIDRVCRVREIYRLRWRTRAKHKNTAAQKKCQGKNKRPNKLTRSPHKTFLLLTQFLYLGQSS